MTRAALIGGLAAFALALSTAVQVHAGTVVKAPVAKSTVAPPTAPCDEDHIWDIYIIRGVWFSCECDHMPFGPPICGWFETEPSADPQALRKLAKQSKKITRLKSGGLLYTPRVRPVVA